MLNTYRCTIALKLFLDLCYFNNIIVKCNIVRCTNRLNPNAGIGIPSGRRAR